MNWRCRGDVVEIETWVNAAGKNGMRRDWIIRDYKTHNIITRATRYIIYMYVCVYISIYIELIHALYWMQYMGDNEQRKQKAE